MIECTPYTPTDPMWVTHGPPGLLILGQKRGGTSRLQLPARKSSWRRFPVPTRTDAPGEPVSHAKYATNAKSGAMALQMVSHVPTAGSIPKRARSARRGENAVRRRQRRQQTENPHRMQIIVPAHHQMHWMQFLSMGF